MTRVRRRAIGPDQIQEGNKIECHVSGSCAGYLDTDGNWQISDNTVRQHFDSPDDSTMGREIWTNRPLTVGVNTYGARDEMVTIRESSSLGKHTEWQITPIDDIDLRRRTQDLDTEYDLGDQVVQATSNNTTRIFTPYNGQERISYEIVAPAGGEIRNENGQLNAYRDNFYLFTIADPTVYDADKQLIVDAKGLPVRCYSICLETVSAEDGVYIVHKELCGDVPDDCAWVDVEIDSSQNRCFYYQDSGWSDVVSLDNPNTYGHLLSSTNSVRIAGVFEGFQLYRNALPFDLSAVFGTVGSASIDFNINTLYSAGDFCICVTDPYTITSVTTSMFEALDRDTATANVFNASSTGAKTVTIDPSGITTGGTLYTQMLSYNWDFLQNPTPPTSSNNEGISIDRNEADVVLTLTIDPGHTGPSTRAEIVGSIPSEGGVIQVDFDGSDPVGLDIANNLSDTSGATDIHFRTVDGSGDPDTLIPFQRLSASGSGSSFDYSAKLDMPAGETDFAICYGPNNPPSSDYVDFSSTVSGTAINSGEESPGEGFWGWPSGDDPGEIVKSVTSNIFGNIIKPIM